jgi:hypothetical protein
MSAALSDSMESRCFMGNADGLRELRSETVEDTAQDAHGLVYLCAGDIERRQPPHSMRAGRDGEQAGGV